MLPDNELSTLAVVRGYNDPVKRPGDFLTDWERGGIGLNDSSTGMLVQLWTLQVLKDVDAPPLLRVVVSSPIVPETLLFTGNDITEASLSFDQNMNPFVAFVQAGQAKIYWYDPVVPGQVTTDLAADVVSPRCCIDQKDPLDIANSDNILAYIRDGWLRLRYQRDRYTVEHDMCEVGDALLVSVAMNVGNQLQFRMRNVTANLDDGRFKVQANPLLADIVYDLCIKSDLKPEQIDVSELYFDEVPGMGVNTDDGLDAPIDWLRSVYFFDKAEYDKKIHFPKRGRQVVARIPYVHLVQGNPTALKRTIIDGMKLPQLINLHHIDPNGGFAKNKQTAGRRSNMVKSKKKETIESQIVLTADQAATAAWTKVKMYWNEQNTYEFRTSIAYTHLTVTDVVEVEDAEGVWHRMRIEDRNEDGKEIEWEAKQDAGTRTYGSFLRGNELKPPVSTTPGLLGETILEILNISPQRDQDDELGVYIAASGTNSAWTGYQLLVSTDGGISFFEAYRADSPSTIGELTTDLLEESSPEYIGDQKVEMLTNYPLSSITDAQLYGNQNRCVIGDECCQFLTATFLGMVSGKYSYRLSGLVRGRYGSFAATWPAGTRFVLFDETVIFVQAQRAMLGQDIEYKPVTFGLTEDETVATAYLYDEGVSQTEWQVAHVANERDVSNNVTVTFVGRARLGLDTAPYPSQYFTGYRIKFSNGHTIDTTNEFGTYAAAPGGITVQVCAMNEITGEGPYSPAQAT